MLLVLVTIEMKALIRALLYNEDRLLGNGDRLPFGCLVGGDLAGDRPAPFTFLVVSICTCGVFFKYIEVMGLVVTLGF